MPPSYPYMPWPDPPERPGGVGQLPPRGEPIPRGPESPRAPDLFKVWWNLNAQSVLAVTEIDLLASAAQAEVVSLAVNEDYVAFITEFGQQIENIGDWPNVQWAIQVQGGPVFPYDDIRTRLGSREDPYELEPPIPVWGGQTIRVVATNLTASAIDNISALLKGRAFPQALFGRR